MFDFWALRCSHGGDEAGVCTLVILHSPSPHSGFSDRFLGSSPCSPRHLSATCCVLLPLCSSLLHLSSCPRSPSLSLSSPPPSPPGPRPQLPPSPSLWVVRASGLGKPEPRWRGRGLSLLLTSAAPTPDGDWRGGTAARLPGCTPSPSPGGSGTLHILLWKQKQLWEAPPPPKVRDTLWGPPPAPAPSPGRLCPSLSLSLSLSLPQSPLPSPLPLPISASQPPSLPPP